MIKIDSLKKSYETVTVLDIDQLEVKKGECFGLVGNNGAGKTTLFSCILDLIKPDTGYVRVGESNVAQDEAWKEVTGSFLDDSFIIGYLTPDEYFRLVGELRGVDIPEIKAHLDKFEKLFNGEIRGVKKYLRDLSKGNMKKVGIAAAMLGKPELVILDEPFANLDPTTQIRLKELLKELQNENGTTLLISSHDLLHVSEISDRIVLLEKGKVIKDLYANQDMLKDLESYFKAQLD